MILTILIVGIVLIFIFKFFKELQNFSPDVPDLEKYKTILDVLLRSTGNSTTTQIDKIIVSNFGIFCIEEKALNGWIYGNVESKYWKQFLQSKEFKFYNPFRQNYAHVKALEVLLGNHLNAPIVSLVTFTRADKIKVSGTDLVGDQVRIDEIIKSYTREVYCDEERDYIFDLIGRANIENREERIRHDIQVEEIQKAKNSYLSRHL